MVARTVAGAINKRAAKRAGRARGDILVMRALAEEADEEEERKTSIELVKGGGLALIQNTQTDGTNT